METPPCADKGSLMLIDKKYCQPQEKSSLPLQKLYIKL